MTRNSTTDRLEVQKFEGSRVWQFNVYGAVVAGIGGFVVLCIVAGILLYQAPGADVFLTVGAIIASAVLGFLCLYPGNLIAVYPFAVELEEGKGVRLLAPMKTVYVPLSELKEVRRSFLALGWVVKLTRRHGALTSFTIHGGFGRQGGELARAIQEEIARRSAGGTESTPA